MDYISRHKKQSAAETRAQREANKAEATRYIVGDAKWFYVVADPGDLTPLHTAEPEKNYCQYTGLEIARGRKNHPLVSDFLSEMAGDKHFTRAYSIACRALSDAPQFDTAQQYVDYARAEVEKAREKTIVAKQRQREEDRELEQRRVEAKRKRQETNRFLRGHGYTWSKEYDEYEEGEGPSLWILWTPDGRQVSVAQALDEIERGADLVESELAAIVEAGGELPYNVVLSGKLEQAAARRKQAKKAKVETKRQAWETAKDGAREGMVVVERFDYAGFETTFNHVSYDTITDIQRIFRGQVNGVDCVVIYRYFGGHDFDETEQFYCADPERAGLVAVAELKPGLAATFAEFFGE